MSEIIGTFSLEHVTNTYNFKLYYIPRITRTVFFKKSEISDYFDLPTKEEKEELEKSTKEELEKDDLPTQSLEQTDPRPIFLSGKNPASDISVDYYHSCI